MTAGLRAALRAPLFAAVLGLGLACSAGADAAIVTYDFEADVTDVLGYLVTDNGADVTGSFTFNTDAAQTFDNGSIAHYDLSDFGTITLNTSFFHFTGPITDNQLSVDPLGGPLDEFFIASEIDLPTENESVFIYLATAGLNLSPDVEIPPSLGRLTSAENVPFADPALHEADGNFTSLTEEIAEPSSLALSLASCTLLLWWMHRRSRPS